MSEPGGRYDEAVAAAAAATNFQAFTKALHLMYSLAGGPAYNQLATRTKKDKAGYVSKSSMSELFRSADPRPTYEFVSKFTKACGVPQEVTAAFERAWSAVNATVHSATRQHPRAGEIPQQRPGVAEAPGIGPAHLATLDHMAALADRLEGDAGHEVARELYQHVYDVCRSLLGPDHERTEDAARDLGTILFELDQYARAYELLDQAVTAYTRRHGPDDPRTLRAMESLAIVQIGRERYGDAVRLARQCVAGRRRSGDGDELEHAVDILVHALGSAGDHQEAGRLRQEFGTGASPADPPGDVAHELLRRGHHTGR